MFGNNNNRAVVAVFSGWSQEQNPATAKHDSKAWNVGNWTRTVIYLSCHSDHQRLKTLDFVERSKASANAYAKCVCCQHSLTEHLSFRQK